MSTKRVTLAEADGHLAELIEAAQRGDEVVIEDNGHAQVQLVALPQVGKPRVLGLHEGLVDIGEDFNDPLPNGFWLGGQP
jgi:antitoxin (DNA-binding transcriptional repressor) of toxin-antitoxin stability system